MERTDWASPAKGLVVEIITTLLESISHAIVAAGSPGVDRNVGAVVKISV